MARPSSVTGEFWHAWCRARALIAEDRAHESVAWLEAALALAAGSEHSAGAQLRAELLTALAGTAFDCGDWQRSLGALAQARSAIDDLPQSTGELKRWLTVSCDIVEAKHGVGGRRYQEAVDLLRRTLSEHFGAGGDALADRSLEATARMVLVPALAYINEVDAALTECVAVQALLDVPALRHAVTKHCAHLMNWASVLLAAGRLDESLRCFEQGIGGFEGLVAAGRLPRRADLARARMNMAGLYTRRGQHGDAIWHGLRAVKELGLEITRRRAADENLHPLVVSLALARRNLAYSYHEAGRPRRAMQWFQRALRDYELLLPSSPHLQDDATRAKVNSAHAELRAGRPAEALRAYEEAARTFAAMAKDGAAHLAADESNATLGAARALARSGRPREAIERAGQALRHLVDLTNTGQLQHAFAWSRAVREIEDSLLQGWLAAPIAEPLLDAGFEAAFDELAALRVREPRFGHPVGADPVRDIDAHVEQLERCSLACAGHLGIQSSWVRYAGAALVAMMDRTAMVLSEAEPDWLLSQQGPLRDLLERCRRFAAGHEQAAVLLTQWFLSSRGLRAQRDWLAFGSDVGVAALRAKLAELRRLEEELLGQTLDAAPGGSDKLRLAGASTPTPALAQQAAAARSQWRALRKQCDEDIERLGAEGRLPQRAHVAWTEVRRQLRPGRALVLVARPVPEQLLLIILLKPGGADVDAEPAVDSLQLSDELARWSCTDLVDTVPLTLAGALRGEPVRRSPSSREHPAEDAAAAAREPPSVNALELMSDLVTRVCATMQQRLSPARISGLDLVVSDDLHAIPWRHLLAEWLPSHGELALYPSAGAWLRHHEGPTRLPGPAGWAIAAASKVEGSPDLPWIAVEAPLTRRLCEAQGGAALEIRSAQQALAGVDALAGMGHGGAIDGNPARAGLNLGSGGLLTGYDLAHIHSCRVVLMSCCVLARTREIGGEPLGFMAAAFGLSTGFAYGWLTEVPDSAACLFGLAFQHALHRARELSAESDVPSCAETFEVTRRDILAGRWPEQFGGWLACHLSALVDELRTDEYVDLRQAFHRMALGGALFRAPPIGLPDLMPWVICLGR